MLKLNIDQQTIKDYSRFNSEKKVMIDAFLEYLKQNKLTVE